MPWLSAAKLIMVVTITTSRATAHRQRRDRSRPSGKVSNRWKIGKMSRIHDQVSTHSTSHSAGVACCGGGSSAASQCVARVLTGSASPGIIRSQPTTLRGCLDTISAPHRTNAARHAVSEIADPRVAIVTSDADWANVHASTPAAPTPMAARIQTARRDQPGGT